MTGDVGGGIVGAAEWVAAQPPGVRAEHRADHPRRAVGAALSRTCTSCTCSSARPGGPSGDRHLEHASARGSIRVRVRRARRAGLRWWSPASAMDEDPGWRALAPGELLHVDGDLAHHDHRVLRSPAGAPADARGPDRQGGELAGADPHVLAAVDRVQRTRMTMATHSAHRAPPGPPLPRAVQTAGFMFGGPRFLNACRRRYGDAVTFGTLFDSKFVMVFHPALIKELFQGSAERLRAGEANAMLGPIVGERSVLLLDGAEHLRHRRLLLPPFHGRRMQAYADADARVGRPRDRLVAGRRAVPAAPEHAVADAAGDHCARCSASSPGPRSRSCAARLRAMLEPVARPRGRWCCSAAPGGAATARPIRPRSRQPAARSTRSCSPRSRAGGADPDARRARRRLLGAAARRGRGRRAAVGPRGPRRADDAAAGRPRDDRHRPRVDVRPAAAHPGRAQARARGRRRLPRRGRQGVAADAPGDPRRRPGRPRRAARAQRLR